MSVTFYTGRKPALKPALLRAVTEALEAALRDDPVKTALHGFTSLGLMEMTRKKTGDIAPVPTSPCPYCHGTGLREDTP